MSHQTTIANAQANFAALCEKVAVSREPITIRRPGGKDVTLVEAAEFRSLMETAHLLGTSNNALRLIAALVRARRNDLPAATMEGL